MTEDSIFLIRSTPFYHTYLCQNCRSLRMFEDDDKNGIRKWSKVWEFGPTENDIFCPPVIQAIENGKFIFFPHETKSRFVKNVVNMTSFNPFELWEMNNTLTRSSLELPIDLRDTIDTTYRLWILQM